MSDPEESPPRALPAKREVRLELIAALLASFVGALALLVSCYSVYWQRIQVRALVWPRLMVAFSRATPDGKPDFRRLVRNVGVGPAQIRFAEVTVDGKPVPTWHAALTALVGDYPGGSKLTSTLNGRVVAAGESYDALHVLDEGLVLRLRGETERLRMEICYCSVLEECWDINDDGVVEPVSACPTRATAFEE